MIELGRRCTLIILVFYCAALVAQQPAPPTPAVTIEHPERLVSAKDMARLTWDGNAMYQTYKRRAYEDLVLLSILENEYRIDQSLDPKIALESLNKLEKDYRQKYSDATGGYHLPEDAVEAAKSAESLAAAYGGTFAAAAKPLADELLKWGIRGYEAYESGPAQIEAQHSIASTQDYAERLGAAVDEAWVLASQNPKAKQVISDFFGPRFNAKPDDSDATIKTRNRDYQLGNEVDDLVNEAKTTTVTTADFEQAATSQLRMLNSSLAQQTKALAVQGAILQAIVNRQIDQAVVEAEKAKYATEIAGARSGVYLLSTLAKLSNRPELARQIAVAGNATVGLIDTIKQYSDAMRTATTTVSSLASTTTLFAGYFSAGLALMSLAQPDSSFESMVIKQLSFISQQLSELREDMKARFDQVDLRLDRLSDAMAADFDVVLRTLASQQVSLDEINASASRIEQGLLGLQINIASLELRFDDYMRAGFSQQFKKNLTLCFAPLTPMDQATLNRCLYSIRYHALDVSLDPLARLPVDDQSLVEYSANRPLAGSYVYVARIGGERFQSAELTTLTTIVANPVEWSLGADSYIQLCLQYPKLTCANAGKDLRLLAAAGTNLRRMSDATRQNELLRKLLDNYSSKVGDIQVALHQAEDTWARAHVAGQSLRRDATLFRYSPLSAISNGRLPPCAASHANYMLPTKTLDLPVGIEKLIPPEVWMADNLGVIKFQICYEATRNNAQSSQIQDVTEELDHGLKMPTHRYLQAPAVRIVGYFDAAGATCNSMDRQIQSATPIWWAWKPTADKSDMATLTIAGKDPGGNAVQAWERELRDRFVDNSTTNFKDQSGVEVTGCIERAGKLADDRFDQLTLDFYQSIVQSRSTGNAVAEAAKGLSAAKIMLQDFLSIGFARTLDRDDGFRGLLFGNAAIAGGDDIFDVYQNVLQGPRKDARTEAMKWLNNHNIEMNKESLLSSTKKGDYYAVFNLLRTGLWDRLTSADKSTVLQAAKSLPPDVDLFGRTLHFVAEADSDGFESRYRAISVSAIGTSEEFIDKTLTERAAQLADAVHQHSSDQSSGPWLVDDELARIALFRKYHGQR